MRPELERLRERCLSEIERRLAGFFDSRAAEGIALNSEMARYQLSTGGKRLRAVIPCLAYSALGADPLKAVPIGCAIEIVHNATLVHDDLQDGDALRRGLPTVWKKYGEAQAINCGDAMFQLGYRMLLEQPAEPALLRKLTLRFSQAITKVIEGQAQEFRLKDEPLPGVAQYLRVVEGKTAALLALCFTLAAESLGLSPALCERIESAGLDLGVLFQMQDDLLDIYGEKGRDRRATDIAEGKISALIAQLVQDAPAPDRERALSILRKPREETTDGEVAEVVGLFEKYGCRDAVLARIRELRARVANQPWREEAPALLDLMTGVGELFLEPIRHLLLDSTS